MKIITEEDVIKLGFKQEQTDDPVFKRAEGMDYKLYIKRLSKKCSIEWNNGDFYCVFWRDLVHEYRPMRLTDLNQVKDAIKLFEL